MFTKKSDASCLWYDEASFLYLKLHLLLVHHIMVTAAVFGSTGATGKHILSYLLKSPEYKRVGAFGRRVTALDTLDPGADKSKLFQKTVNFEKIGAEQALKEPWDGVFIASVNPLLARAKKRN